MTAISLPFRDRSDAGRLLAERLAAYAGDDPMVLALPRGGVPVARPVADLLRTPLDVFVVRKLGVPGHPELAMGAIAGGGVMAVNADVTHQLGIPRAVVEEAAAREQVELERRNQRYRRGRNPPDVKGRTVILIDDGLATGATMEAAVLALRAQSPARIVVAVPVGASDTCQRLRTSADEVVCLATPEPFRAVGFWYEEFSQTMDEEVMAALERDG
jgi:predicted phosphoribosyltransferase